MASSLGKARAVMRLLSVAGLTLWHFIKLLLAPRHIATSSSEQAKRAQAWARDLCRAAGIRIQFGGGEPPPPGTVLVSNHRSYADIFVLAAATPVVFLAKKEIESWPVFGRAAKAGGTVFVDRKSRQSGAEALRHLGDRLRAGATIVVFPEGTTQGGPGIGSFRTGSFRLAAAEKVPLVPVALEFERPEDAWTDPDDSSFVSHFLTKFSRREVWVKVKFGPVMQGDDPEALKAAAESWISSNLEAPSAEASETHTAVA